MKHRLTNEAILNFEPESSPSSLTFGGWDEARMPGGGIVVPKDNSSDLLVSVQSLVIANSLQGTISFPEDTKNLSMAIDSTTSQMWLPRVICDKLEEVFGLTFDNNTGLYLVNSTVHSRLLELNPEVTFTLAANASTSSTTNIVLPYAALDLAVGVPFYNSTSTISYFPIRRAENTTQYTLGRVLLQEAYLVVDYERSNFTIGQTNHTSQQRIVSISSPQPSGKADLGSGAIAGIVVGVIALLAILATLAWFLWRQKARRTKSAVHELAAKERAGASLTNADKTKHLHPPTAELPCRQVTGAELMSESVHELPEEQMKYQLMSTPVHELPGLEAEYELPARASKVTEK